MEAIKQDYLPNLNDKGATKIKEWLLSMFVKLNETFQMDDGLQTLNDVDARKLDILLDLIDHLITSQLNPHKKAISNLHEFYNWDSSIKRNKNQHASNDDDQCYDNLHGFSPDISSLESSISLDKQDELSSKGAKQSP